MKENQLLEQLKSEVEKALDRRIATPKDFDHLSERIYARLHIMLSATTLKRLWGYLKEDNTPRLATLDILARFTGYENWDDFCQSVGNKEQVQSNIIASRSLSSEQLEPGNRLILTWLPDRKCEIEYCGDHRFKVISAQNSKLRPDATFKCHLFIEGEPLYVDELCQNHVDIGSYVAGKINGIRFELIGK